MRVPADGYEHDMADGGFERDRETLSGALLEDHL